MMVRRKPQLALATLAALEPRTYLSAAPTLLGSVTLPGAGSSWDFSNGPWSPSPIFADLNGDGSQEVLVVGGDDKIHAYKYVNNTITDYRDFAQTQNVDLIQSTPVVVSTPAGIAVYAGTHAGLVYGWSAATGQVLPGWPKVLPLSWDVAGQPNQVLTAVTAADINGDGVPEILVSGIEHELSAYTYNGTLLWQANNDDTILSSPVVGDINGDGSADIVEGGDSSPSGIYWQGGRVNVLSSTGQRELVYQTNQVVWSSPALADMTGSGMLDVVVGSGLFYSKDSAGDYPGNYVYAFDGNGNNLPGWPFHTESSDTTDGRVQSSPAIADLNGDGKLDVVVGDANGEVIAINNNGTQLWRTTLAAGVNIWSSPVIADINGDGKPDVIIGLGSDVWGLDGATGAVLWHTATLNNFYYNAPAVGHFLGNSSWQVVTLANQVNGQLQPLAPSLMTIYTTPATTLAPPWAQFRRDGSNTAVARNPAVDTALINSLYTNVLGRSAGPSEVAYWQPIFDRAGILQSVVQQVIGSNEARGIQITNWYQLYLNRAPDPNGAAYWQSYIAAGNSYASAQGQFAASAEAYSLRGGGTNDGWVTYLYEVLLGRVPSTSEKSYWLGKLNAGTSRAAVAQGFLLSTERTDDFVDLAFTQYAPGGLTAPAADTLEAAGWDLRRNARTEEVVLDNILGSNGNYLLTQTEGSWIRGLYTDSLGRAPTATETASWLTQMEAGTTMATIATDVINSQEFHLHLINTYYQEFLGRNASASDQQYWAGLIANGNKTEDAVIHDLLGSAEYYARAGGTNTGYINQVFEDLLGRPPSSAELSMWLANANSQNIQNTLPNLILFGAPDEYHRHLIDNLYFWYDRRLASTDADGSALIQPGTPFGATANETFLNNGGNPDTLRISIVTSSTYIQLWRTKAIWAGARRLDNPRFTLFA